MPMCDSFSSIIDLGGKDNFGRPENAVVGCALSEMLSTFIRFSGDYICRSIIAACPCDEFLKIYVD